MSSAPSTTDVCTRAMNDRDPIHCDVCGHARNYHRHRFEPVSEAVRSLDALPWVGNSAGLVKDVHGETVAIVTGALSRTPGSRSMDEQREVAEFMARACNSHHELLAALKELRAVVKGECPSLLNEDSGGDAVLDIAINDAIAKAESK